MTVTFHELTAVPDEALRFAVIMAQHRKGWLWCRKAGRNTWEIPGGKREPGEAIVDTARRELQEETGAKTFRLAPLCAYCVERDGDKSYGLLALAQVRRLGQLNHEIDQTAVYQDDPKDLTYPDIQPHLARYVRHYIDVEQENRDNKYSKSDLISDLVDFALSLLDAFAN